MAKRAKFRVRGDVVCTPGCQLQRCAPPPGHKPEHFPELDGFRKVHAPQSQSVTTASRRLAAIRSPCRLREVYRIRLLGEDLRKSNHCAGVSSHRSHLQGAGRISLHLLSTIVVHREETLNEFLMPPLLTSTDNDNHLSDVTSILEGRK